MTEEIGGMTVLRDAATLFKHLGIYIFGLGKRVYFAVKSVICEGREEKNE